MIKLWGKNYLFFEWRWHFSIILETAKNKHELEFTTPHLWLGKYPF